jgi:UDP-N-acetylmuramoyl-L-alanyl-D-glutamate--2,6-diaminopimelate ligase
MVKAIFDHVGRACGVIGTMNSPHTTPESPELQRALAGFVSRGNRAAAIEVSSVGLVQRRVDGVEFAAAIFTNLTPDELWIHGSVEEYFRAKASLFTRERTPIAVVNVDSEWGRRLAAEIGARVTTLPYSIDDVTDLELRVGGSSFAWQGARVDLGIDAGFNVTNAVGALTATAALGVAPDAAANALSEMPPIAGHSEAVDVGQPFRVVVDFAHTAGALEAVLRDARRATSGAGRVIAVFGCGGDRDPGRRKPMGEAAARAADVVIVTSDNPRTEDPEVIIAEVVNGAREAHARDLRVSTDRRAAIDIAIREARGGDVVVIAGKGHETGQIVGAEVLPFDDREVALDALRAHGHVGAGA